MQKYCPRCDTKINTDADKCPDDGARLIDLEQDKAAGSTFEGKHNILYTKAARPHDKVYCSAKSSGAPSHAIRVLRLAKGLNPEMAKKVVAAIKSQSRLNNKNIVPILQVGQSKDGGLYFIRDYVLGEPLSMTLRDVGGLGPELFYELATQLCGGLDYAHKKGLLHRNLTADNVILSRQGTKTIAQITDFQLVPATQALCKAQFDGAGLSEERFCSAVAHLPAEAISSYAKSGKKSTDMYSLGVILYTMITGHWPWTGDEADEVIKKKNRGDSPRALSAKAEWVNEELEGIVMRLLAPNPDDRFESAEEVGELLFQWSKTSPELDKMKTQRRTAEEIRALQETETVVAPAREASKSLPMPVVAGLTVAAVAVFIWSIYDPKWFIPEEQIKVEQLQTVTSALEQEWLKSMEENE